MVHAQSGPSTGFEEDGYCVFPDTLCPEDLSLVAQDLPKLENSGSRLLLEISSIQRLATELKSHPMLQQLIVKLDCVQVIYFRKSQDHNWSLKLHRDSVYPIAGEGTWDSAGIKEGVPYVHIPREWTDRFICVRVSLDDAPEGDLLIEPGSHVHSDAGRCSTNVVQVPRGGALVLRPSLLHGSKKLTSSPSRRVLHFVYAPADLPDGYRWYFAR